MNLQKRLVMGVACAAVPALTAGAGIVYSFESESDLSANCTANRNGVPNENFERNATGGLGGTGGIRYSSVTFPVVRIDAPLASPR